VILRSLQLDAGELARATGWTLTPDGFCKGETCIAYRVPAEGRIDARDVASRLAMPLVEDAGAGLWALGPPSGGRALASAEAPDLELPDLDGRPFRLSSLRGWKVLLLAWAPW
jgi:hypothetical protein